MHADAPRRSLLRRQFRSRVPTMVKRRIWRIMVENRALSSAYFALDPDLRDRRPRRSTELVIDGYIRSANTYALCAFLHANGEDRGVSHHIHHPVVFEKAARLGIPALLVVRRPEDVLASSLQFLPEAAAHQVLATYALYHERMLALNDSIVVSDFPETVSNFGAAISRVNSRFGTDFAPYRKTPENEASVIEAVEEFSRRNHGMHKVSFEARVSRPEPTRKSSASFLGDLSREDQALLERAQQAYASLLATHTSQDEPR